MTFYEWRRGKEGRGSRPWQFGRQSLSNWNRFYRAISNIALATIVAEDFAIFSSCCGREKSEAKVFTTFRFGPCCMAEKRLFRPCGFAMTSQETCQSCSVLAKSDIRPTSNEFYIEKLLHKVRGEHFRIQRGLVTRKHLCLALLWVACTEIGLLKRVFWSSGNLV